MNFLHRIVLTAAFLPLFTCAAHAQQRSPEKTETGALPVQAATSLPRPSVIRLHPPSIRMPHVTGAPYSAEEVFDAAQTLGNGTHITQKARITKVYRDSEGRTRTERPAFLGGDASDLPPIVEIRDPVSGFRYILDVQNRIAHRFSPPQEIANDAVPPPTTATTVSAGAAPSATPKISTVVPAQENRLQVSTESLGSQVIEGVYAEGKKTTRIIPVGVMGNDRPLVSVFESWSSPDLKIDVLFKNSDPRMGESTMHLRNIERSEPNPALFRVPPEYKMVDETGEFEIRYTRP